MNAKVLALGAMIAGAVVVAPVAQADEALVKKYGCMACHQVDKKVIGPSYKDVAAKYKGKSDADVVAAVKASKSHASSKASDDDLKALGKWILSL